MHLLIFPEYMCPNPMEKTVNNPASQGFRGLSIMSLSVYLEHDGGGRGSQGFPMTSLQMKNSVLRPPVRAARPG
jgi:hypothetical protein